MHLIAPMFWENIFVALGQAREHQLLLSLILYLLDGKRLLTHSSFSVGAARLILILCFSCYPVEDLWTTEQQTYSVLSRSGPPWLPVTDHPHFSMTGWKVLACTLCQKAKWTQPPEGFGCVTVTCFRAQNPECKLGDGFWVLYAAYPRL